MTAPFSRSCQISWTLCLCCVWCPLSLKSPQFWILLICTTFQWFHSTKFFSQGHPKIPWRKQNFSFGTKTSSLWLYLMLLFVPIIHDSQLWVHSIRDPGNFWNCSVLPPPVSTHSGWGDLQSFSSGFNMQTGIKFKTIKLEVLKGVPCPPLISVMSFNCSWMTQVGHFQIPGHSFMRWGRENSWAPNRSHAACKMAYK